MDNLTHGLMGLAAAKAGLERLSPGATTLCVLAANAPDADILALFGGRWTYLQNHRGITHSIVGTLALALFVPLLFYLADFIHARLRRRAMRVRLRGLLLASLIVSATHPLMDWTNNYGVRPLLPWSGRWFYGDLVFIVDPWLWLLLGGASFLLTARGLWRQATWAVLALIVTGLLFLSPLGRTGLDHPLVIRVLWLSGLAALLVAHYFGLARKVNGSLAQLALALVVVYWGGLALVHSIAMTKARNVSSFLALQHKEAVESVAAMPTLANPAKWQSVVETNRAIYRFDLYLNLEDAENEAFRSQRYEKPEGCDAEAVARASQDRGARVFLGFARYPMARVQGDCLGQALVQFADLRYTEPGAQGRGNFALEVPISAPTQQPSEKEAK